MKEIRYDELKTGDIILFHGANERVVSVDIRQGIKSKYAPAEKLVSFRLAPADREAEELLGKFYSRGRYGGIGSLKTKLVYRQP